MMNEEPAEAVVVANPGNLLRTDFLENNPNVYSVKHKFDPVMKGGQADTFRDTNRRPIKTPSFDNHKKRQQELLADMVSVSGPQFEKSFDLNKVFDMNVNKAHEKPIVRESQIHMDKRQLIKDMLAYKPNMYNGLEQYRSALRSDPIIPQSSYLRGMLTQKNTNPDAPDTTDAYIPKEEIEQVLGQIDAHQQFRRPYLAGKLKVDEDTGRIVNPETGDDYKRGKRATGAQSSYTDGKGVVHNIVQDKDDQRNLKQAKLSIAGTSGDPDLPGTVAKAKGKKEKPISVTEQKIMDREGISKENLDAVKKMTTSGDVRKLEGNIASAKLIQRIARGRVARQRKDDAISAVAKEGYLKSKPDMLESMSDNRKQEYNDLKPEEKKVFDKEAIRQTKKNMIVELKQGALHEASLHNQLRNTLVKQEKDLIDVATTKTHWVMDDWNKNKSALSKVIKNIGNDKPNSEAVLGNLIKTLDWIKTQDDKEATRTGKRSSAKFNLFRSAVQKHMIKNGGIPEDVKLTVKQLKNTDIAKRYFIAQKPRQDKSEPSTPKRRASIMPRENYETPNQPPSDGGAVWT